MSETEIDFQYDVFLSHASADKAAVRELAERLKGDGLRVWPRRMTASGRAGSARSIPLETRLALDAAEEFPREIIQELLGPDVGLHLVFIPEELGGLGVSSVHDLVVASSRLARGDASVAIGVNAVFNHVRPSSRTRGRSCSAWPRSPGGSGSWARCPPGSRNIRPR